MDLLRAVLGTVAILAVITFFTVTAVAYGKRRDRGFWGGGSMLTGWWLLSPYDEGGISPEHWRLV